jgi:hypothetical protein
MIETRLVTAPTSAAATSPTFGMAAKSVNGEIDIGGVTNANCDWLQRRCVGSNFEGTVKEFAHRRNVWPGKDKAYPCYMRCDLSKKLQPFPSDRELEGSESSYVVAGVGKTSNQPCADRIGKIYKYDRHRLRLPP